MKVNHKTKFEKVKVPEYLIDLNIQDFDKFYEDVILAYNNVKPSEFDFVDDICKTANGAGLRDMLFNIEMHFNVTFDFLATRIFKTECEAFVKILKDGFGYNNTDIRSIIDIAYDPASQLNTSLSNYDMSKFIIVVKSLHLWPMRQYDPSGIVYDYMRIIHQYNEILYDMQMTSSYGYGIHANILDIVGYIGTFKKLPITRRESASITSHPFDY